MELFLNFIKFILAKGEGFINNLIELQFVNILLVMLD